MCIKLSNEKCKIQPTLVNLHPNEYSQEFHYCSFTVKLERCVGSCTTLNDLSNKICIQNKTEDLNLSIFKHDYRYKRIENINKTCFMQI